MNPVVLATNNNFFPAEIDADAESVITITFTEGEVYDDWNYEVRNRKSSAILWETDSSATGKIVADNTAKTLTLTVPKNVLAEGQYYHKLYTDSSNATDKLRFGGDRMLTVKHF